MKRKRLALLLAAAMTVTSLDSAAVFVSGADFSSEVEEEVTTQAQEGEEENVVTDEASTDVDFSDEEAEVTETPEASDVEVTEEEPSQETEVQVEDEEAAEEDVADFSAEFQDAAEAGDETPIDVSKLTALNLGKNDAKVTGEALPIHWYYFEAKDAGIYDFSWEMLDDNDDYGISWNWKELDKDGTWSDASLVEASDGTGYQMAAGAKYLVALRDYWYDDRTYDTTITVTKVQKVSSVKLVDSKEKYEFTEHLEEVYPQGIQAKVTYEDNSEQTIGIGDNDSYGRSLNYQLYDLNGNEVNDSCPPAGDYKFKFYCGTVAADKEIPVKVVPMDSKTNGQITDGTADFDNNGNVLLKYTASDDGRYQFIFNAAVSNVEIRKADGASVWLDEEEKSVIADLEKGVTYFVYATPDEYCKKLNVKVTSKLTRPTTLSVRSLRKADYIAGIDCFSDDDMEATVNFGNTSSTVRGSGSVEGCSVGYRLEDEKGTEARNGDTLEKGTWTVTPYLSSGSAVNIPVSTTTVKAVMYDEATLKKLPVLNENTWNTLNNRYGEREIYTFKPGETGAYKVEYLVENHAYPFSIYEAAENEYRSVDIQDEDNSTVRLDSTKTYLVVNEYGAAKLKFSRLNSGLKPETVKELALTDGMKKAVDIDKTTGYINCTFTPKEDGYYTLKSSSYEGLNADTYAELYQGDTPIAGDDESGGHHDFKLTEKLLAGKAYTYKVRLFEGYSEFVLEFNKTEHKNIKAVDLVTKNGKNPADCSVFDNLGDYYQVKVTYEDGTTWIKEYNAAYYSAEEPEDPYGNKITADSIWKDSISGNKVSGQIVIEYYQDNKRNSVKKDISCKGVGSFTEAKEGQNYDIPKKQTMYKFIPQKTAEYIWTYAEDTAPAYFDVYTAETTSLYMLVGKRYEGRYGTYSAKLEKGKVYYISTVSYADDITTKFCIKPESKTLTGLTLKKAPAQDAILHNNGDRVSLKGLQAEASYADGTKAVVTYGTADTNGRYLHLDRVEWKADGTARVYVALGRYTTYYDVKTASWEKIEEIKLNESKTLDIAKDDAGTLKFVPKESGVYYVYVTNGGVDGVIRGTNAENDREYYSGCYLKAGETYYVSIRAEKDNPTVTIKAACKDDKHSFEDWKIKKAATCVTEGLRSHTCKSCGIYEEEVIPATGKHTMSGWKVTSAATVSREGSQVRVCSVCGKKETAKIAKLRPTVKLNVAANKTIPLKQKQTFQAKAYGLANGDRVVSWTSSNKKVATVSRTGKIVAKKAYKKPVTITVKLQSGLTARFKVKVQKTAVATTSLRVVNKATGKTLKSATLKVKKKLTLSAKIAPVTSKQKVTYTSSNKKIATVSSKGVITAKKKGTVTITVKSGKKSVKIKVKVKK